VKTFAFPHEFVPLPWNELRQRYCDLTDAHPSMKYLLDIVESIERSGSSDALAGATSMHDLMVVDTPISAPPVEFIVVRAPGSLRPPSDGCVRIEHRAHTNRNDEIERPEDEAVRLFWRFVREKFGLAVRKPSQVFGRPVARYVQVRDDGTIDARLDDWWATFNEALADAVTSLPPRGSTERRLSTYWIDDVLRRVEDFKQSRGGGVVASGNAYSISVSLPDDDATARFDYGDADTHESMTIEEFVTVLSGWRMAVIDARRVEQREVTETYRRNPWRGPLS